MARKRGLSGKNKRGQIGYPLHDAVRREDVEIVDRLLDSGLSLADTDAHGSTPLHIAATRRPEMVELLLLKGADKDVFDNVCRTPLYLAVDKGNVVAALALLAAGADVTLRCCRTKAPVMHVAAEKGHVEILRAVIEHGADVDAVDANQCTALHHAALNDEAEAIDVLVGAGAKIEAQHRYDFTPFHCAANRLSHEALLRLLKHGAVVDARTDLLETPLILAATQAGIEGAAEVVESLLRAGADETMADDQGNKATDVIGAADVEEEGSTVVDDVERVRELLANAPADRAWRRRGYLLLCRAHSDRVQLGQAIDITTRADTRRRTRSHAKLVRTEGIAGDSTVDDGSGGDWAVVMSKVLWLQEEGIFQMIVGYL